MITKSGNSKGMLAVVLVIAAIMAIHFTILSVPAQAAEPGPLSLSRSSGVSVGEHPEERLRTMKSVAPEHRRVLQQVPPSEISAASPPRWTETIAQPEPPTKAPNPNVRPDVWVDPRRN